MKELKVKYNPFLQTIALFLKKKKKISDSFKMPQGLKIN